MSSVVLVRQRSESSARLQLELRRRVEGLEHRFDFLLAGADVAGQAAAGQLDGHLRRQSGRRSPGRCAAIVRKNAISAAPDELHLHDQRREEAVRQQNAQERADEGGADFVADLFDRAVDVRPS